MTEEAVAPLPLRVLGWRGMRRLPLLLLLYVTLDFANPLMPGAVRFEAGSVEVVQADRIARAAVAAMPAQAARDEAPLDPDRAQRVRVPVSLGPRPLRRLARRVPSRRSTPSPSSTDDH